MDKQLLLDEIKTAMRGQDKARLSILRMVKNEIDTKEKESGEDVSDAEVIADGSYSEKRDMGTVIGAVVEETGGNCDKAEVAGIVGARLS